MSENKENDLIISLKTDREPGRRSSSTDVKTAIERFRDNSESVPLDRLYTAYRSLKGLIDSFGDEFSSQSAHFNDLFLRILEERGESGSGIYRSVLRDSAEFSILSGMLSRDDQDKPELVPEPADIPEEIQPERLTLKKILSSKKVSPADFSEEEWGILVDEHFTGIEEEKLLVKSCSSVIASLTKRADLSGYHLVIIIEYIFRRLNCYDEIGTGSKEFAMRLINLMSGSTDAWKRLHGEYLEIIRK